MYSRLHTSHVAEVLSRIQTHRHYFTRFQHTLSYFSLCFVQTLSSRGECHWPADLLACFDQGHSRDGFSSHQTTKTHQSSPLGRKEVNNVRKAEMALQADGAVHQMPNKLVITSYQQLMSQFFICKSCGICELLPHISFEEQLFSCSVVHNIS